MFNVVLFHYFLTTTAETMSAARFELRSSEKMAYDLTIYRQFWSSSKPCQTTNTAFIQAFYSAHFLNAK